VDYEKARTVLIEEASKPAAHVDRTWDSAIETFHKACHGAARTHIAVLGTAILAKCVDSHVDVFALQKRAGPSGYSARTLSNKVLAPKAREMDIHLGVTGLEPHQNSPYTGETRIRRDFDVQPYARPAFDMMCDLLDRVAALPDEKAARVALRAFIAVCRRNGPRYSATIDPTLDVTIDDLVARIKAFVAQASDGGRRAQAVVAALMDILVGPDRVVTSRINDPSRSAPGDVLVKSTGGGWERTIEVRDKPVDHDDLINLASRAAGKALHEVSMVAVAATQTPLDSAEAQAWAAQRAVNLTVFLEWGPLIRQILLWGPTSSLQAAKDLPAFILERLVSLEVPVSTAEAWTALFPAPEPEEDQETE
jgi:hypothetical protein